VSRWKNEAVVSKQVKKGKALRSQKKIGLTRRLVNPASEFSSSVKPPEVVAKHGYQEEKTSKPAPPARPENRSNPRAVPMIEAQPHPEGRPSKRVTRFASPHSISVSVVDEKTVSPDIAFDEVATWAADLVPLKRIRGKYKSKFVGETPRQRARRDTGYVLKSKARKREELAKSLGYESAADHKMSERHKRFEEINRKEIERAMRGGDYSKLTALRRALVYFTEALNAEFNKAVTERGDFREVAFRLQLLTNLKSTIA
jgi:hypothetical protein